MKKIVYAFICSFVVTLVICGFRGNILYVGEFTQDGNRAEFLEYRRGRLNRYPFSKEDLDHRFNISVNGSDVLNLIRIQKTGSTTMDIHLTQNLDISRWCDCDITPMESCECFTEWKKKVLFKQKTNHWPCGTHADWTYLQECVETMQRNSSFKKRQLYLTMIRDPVRRFISEWKHVARGATWYDESNICKGTRMPSAKCYTSFDWRGVSLRDFMNCSTNLAINRQTRKLADLTLVNCYNTSGMSYEDRNVRMLESAKENLRKMAFFGVTDYQVLTQVLFEYTFHLTFVNGFVDEKDENTHSGNVTLATNTLNKIMKLNKYDMRLYQYGKDLFLRRLSTVAKNTPNHTLREDIYRRLKYIDD